MILMFFSNILWKFIADTKLYYGLLVIMNVFWVALLWAKDYEGMFIIIIF